MGNQRQHTEDAKQCSGKAEHKGRAAERQCTDSDENGQNHNDRSDENFKYQPHKIGPLYNS